MADPLDVVDFEADDLEPLLLLARGRVRSANGWVNLFPVVDDPGDVPRTSVWGSIFGAKGPAIPMCTWTVDSIGIEHRAGTKAGRVLAEAGLTMPDGWRPVQDSPRRGLVVELPSGVDPVDVVRWLVRAGTALSQVPTSGHWRAVVYG